VNTWTISLAARRTALRVEGKDHARMEGVGVKLPEGPARVVRVIKTTTIVIWCRRLVVRSDWGTPHRQEHSSFAGSARVPAADGPRRHVAELDLPSSDPQSTDAVLACAAIIALRIAKGMSETDKKMKRPTEHMRDPWRTLVRTSTKDKYLDVMKGRRRSRSDPAEAAPPPARPRRSTEVSSSSNC
jgi:hypothetical protein